MKFLIFLLELIGEKLLEKLVFRGGKIFMEDVIIKILAAILDKINDNKQVREFVKNLGAVVAEYIPGDEIEHELIEFLDLLKQGIAEKSNIDEN